MIEVAARISKIVGHRHVVNLRAARLQSESQVAWCLLQQLQRCVTMDKFGFGRIRWGLVRRGEAW